MWGESPQGPTARLWVWKPRAAVLGRTLWPVTIPEPQTKGTSWVAGPQESPKDYSHPILATPPARAHRGPTNNPKGSAMATSDPRASHTHCGATHRWAPWQQGNRWASKRRPQGGSH